jgi:hypothetical protein
MTETLQTIASLSAELLRYESRIKATEATLANLKEIYRRIAELELPKAMNAAALSEFRMSDGHRISVGLDTQDGIPKARGSQTFEWFREPRQGLKAS